jgi:hypothetical protein
MGKATPRLTIGEIGRYPLDWNGNVVEGRIIFSYSNHEARKDGV